MTPELFSVELLTVLFMVAMLAGCIDAIAGGGGLLVLPVLLWCGLSPVQALATNKLQGVFGTATATVRFIRKGQLQLPGLWPMVLMTFIGSSLGTISVQLLDNTLLQQLIPFLLIAFALWFLLSPELGVREAHPRLGRWPFAFTAGFGIGFYDGFFGPGTGAFLALAFVTLYGCNLLRATTHAKLLNFTSNLASVVFFSLAGQMVWKIGLVMAAGQIAGGWLGAHMVVKHGHGLIRPVLVVISVLISVKLLLSG